MFDTGIPLNPDYVYWILCARTVTWCFILDDYLDEPLISCVVILTDWKRTQVMISDFRVLQHLWSRTRCLRMIVFFFLVSNAVEKVGYRFCYKTQSSKTCVRNKRESRLSGSC